MGDSPKTDAFANFHRKCSAESGSPRYQAAIKHLRRIIFGAYVPTLRVIVLYSTRGAAIYDQFISIRMIDSFLESSISILYMAEEGFINQAKRELRFLLESALKYWYLDQVMMGATFKEKMDRYSEILSGSSLSFLDKVRIYCIPEKSDFHSRTNGLYVELCKFVHASKTQSNDRIEKIEKGEFLGFTSAEEIEVLCNLAFRTLDIALACHFSACGPSTTGDLFIHVLDERKDWKFHQGYFVKQISESFNYKAERKK